MAKPTINLNQITYDTYTSFQGKKFYNVTEVIEGNPDKHSNITFKLKCVDQYGEVHYEEFTMSVYGMRKLKKFLDKTKMLTDKELTNFNHFMLIDKYFQLEYFNTKNKYYEPTNPNSREFTLTVGNDTYKPLTKKEYEEEVKRVKNADNADNAEDENKD